MSVDIDCVYSQVTEAKSKLARARKPEMYINTILSLWGSMNAYLEYTKAKKYKSNAKYREIKRIVSALENGSEEYQEKLLIAANKERKAKARRDAKELKISLDKFNNYETDWFRVGEKDFVRLSQDGQHVETSQRVKIKAHNALTLYKLIKRGVNIKGHRIEHYTVTSINGTLKIGCHNISMDSVHAVGVKLLKQA